MDSKGRKTAVLFCMAAFWCILPLGSDVRGDCSQQNASGMSNAGVISGTGAGTAGSQVALGASTTGRTAAASTIASSVAATTVEVHTAAASLATTSVAPPAWASATSTVKPTTTGQQQGPTSSPSRLDSVPGAPASQDASTVYDPRSDPNLRNGGKPVDTDKVGPLAGTFQESQWKPLDTRTQNIQDQPPPQPQPPEYLSATTFAVTTTVAATAATPTSMPPSGTGTGGLSDVTVNSQTITISVWDHGTVDNDIVNIMLNGAVIPGGAGVVLAKSPKVFTLALNPGKNVIAIYAVNEGKVPPNTASIRISHVTSGKAEQTYSINQQTSAQCSATVQ